MKNATFACWIASATLAGGFLAACGQGQAEDRTPLHGHLACSIARPSSSGCTPAKTMAALESWTLEALRRSGSTFTVWTTGHDRDAIRPVFVACVPTRWGSGLMQAKAAFVRAARQQADRVDLHARGTVSVPSGCIPPATTTGLDRLLSVDGEAPSTPREAAVALHAAAVCDRSDSGLKMSCSEDALRHAFHSWMADGGTAPGASFRVFVVGTSRDTTRRAFHVTTPNRSLGERVAYLMGAAHELEMSIFAVPAENDASAVAEAIHVAVGELNEQSRSSRLYVLSDLRQYTPGVWNFEHSVPSADAFTAWLKAKGLVVDLGGLSIRVCGLHHERGPGAAPFDARIADSVRNTWTSVFRTMGAGAAEILSRCQTDQSRAST